MYTTQQCKSNYSNSTIHCCVTTRWWLPYCPKDMYCVSLSAKDQCIVDETYACMVVAVAAHSSVLYQQRDKHNHRTLKGFWQIAQISSGCAARTRTTGRLLTDCYRRLVIINAQCKTTTNVSIVPERVLDDLVELYEVIRWLLVVKHLTLCHDLVYNIYRCSHTSRRIKTSALSIPLIIQSSCIR